MKITLKDVPALVAIDQTKDWKPFTDMLFGLQDADPGYMLLNRASIPYDQKLRYVLAWCTFYNPGLAAKASDYQGKKFYEYLRTIYPTAKRATERRHFRGQAGLKALASWEAAYPRPEDMVLACFGPTYMDVRKNMKPMYLLGDYFYWKLADIQDTVFGHYVDFTGAEQYMPQLPKQGAAIIADMQYDGLLGVDGLLAKQELVEVMEVVTGHASRLKHPFQDRALALQEAETVCCVFKQHIYGNYRYGFRSAKAYKRLTSMRAETTTANKLLEGLYAGGIWDEPKLQKVAESL